VDNAGNIGSLSAERSGATNASSDTTIPSVAITSPANNASLPRGNILVQGTASDNPGGSGIFDVEVRTDNNPCHNYPSISRELVDMVDNGTAQQ
jgi:Big-like domain-containing protein